ncbi:hypothetical protein Gotri_018151 [Gossypium trilobum]|uniref:ORM1-like protein 3 n=1 Tax=Gossypium trilobum TaxID=34281 RepID=A0A7J9E9D6_9ROSI|nr:hypothetical protein [Gossypium trilobum]
MYLEVWTIYILILFLAPCSFRLRLFSWHGLDHHQPLSFPRTIPIYYFFFYSLIITCHFFHWKKGTPFAEDQRMYNGLTWWEQIDNGKQLTPNRKFLTIVPVILYLIASHTIDYQHPMLFFNTIVVVVLVVAKFPNMHKVRIFGINSKY